MEKLFHHARGGSIALRRSARRLRRAILIGKLLRRQNTPPEIIHRRLATASPAMIVGTGLLKIDLRIITAILAAAAAALQLSECSGEAH